MVVALVIALATISVIASVVIVWVQSWFTR
jgi:hypothetical protein